MASEYTEHASLFICRNNGIDAMDTLIARRANINLQIAANGVTLVTFAIFSGTKDIIHRLLNEKKCDVNLQYSNGVTPMHAACIMGILDVCESLLRLGAYTEARTAEDMTPLHFAASNADAKIVELLIKSGKDNKLSLSHFLVSQLPQHSTIQRSVTQRNTAQHNTSQQNTTQRNTAQHSTIQPNPTQPNPTQRNTAQLNAAQHNEMLQGNLTKRDKHTIIDINVSTYSSSQCTN